MKPILIWGENESPGPQGSGPSCGVGLWAEVLGLEWVRWVPGHAPDLSGVDIAFVNLFHTPDSTHITELRTTYPRMKLIGMVDPSLDLVLSRIDWMNIYRQLSRCDVIGGRTYADCRYYGTLLRKPTVYLPSPIGPTAWFEPLRSLPTQPFILTLDHAFAPTATGPNVAAVAGIHRATGLPIKYVAEREWSKDYIKYAGIEAEFMGSVPFQDMAVLTAQATLCIDLYMSHSFGRQQVLCGMVGTPILASTYCREAPGVHVDPLNLDTAILEGVQLVTDAYYAEFHISQGLSLVETFAYKASLERIMQVMVEVLS